MLSILIMHFAKTSIKMVEFCNFWNLWDHWNFYCI